MNSSIQGFYKLTPEERMKKVVELTGITEEESKAILENGELSLNLADHMIENVIGTFTLPMGVALNFTVNGKDVLIPMVTEEASVVAAASNAAKMAKVSGGFVTSSTGPIMIAQVQITEVENPYFVRNVIIENKEKIKKICNDKDPVLLKFGGGFHDIDVRILNTERGQMVILHLLINVGDAMGANAVNTMAEAVSPFIEEITGYKVDLRILSNLATYRLARARAVYTKESLSKTGDAKDGEKIIERILDAFAFAANDPYRAATHNKGIMNGISAAVLASGNDTRAIESGAHTYAAISGKYTSLTKWEKNADGNLVGTIELPMAVGLVGGATKIHPAAKSAVKILGVKTATELGEIYAALGLAQNLAAIRALATDGIQRGHMKLHARNIAASVGATGEMLEKIVDQMIGEKNINAEYALTLFLEYSSK
ncbi:hydroxymethylglutaryl-CoA reductase, degradative [Fusobacterium sp. PH5-44]|uniref:hydroxymethylglutaryl-CoA reductase, degradative n=1 Tax=unclassified Fusobacterium TaxID=2648384 RepID=UPI003D1A0B2F